MKDKVRRDDMQEPVRKPDWEEKAQNDERPGDVLGLGDAKGEIPRATSDRSGNPKGIEVRERTTGTGDLMRGKGATGIDMGAGGKGTGITDESAKHHRDE